MFYYIRRLRVDHWGWIHAKTALILWGVLYILVPPPGPLKELGPFLNTLIPLFTIVGAVLGIVGLLISTSRIPVVRYRGLTIELCGLSLLVCGPLTYFVTQVALINDEHVRVTIAAFGYAFTSFIIARILVVWRVLRGKSHD